MRPHEEYLELCALLTTGELSDSDQQKLQEHIAKCPSCREALSEFETAASIGAPLLASLIVSPQVASEHLEPRTIEFPGPEVGAREAGHGPSDPAAYPHRSADRAAPLDWNYVWLSFAAAVLLAVALGLYSYEAGTRHAPKVAPPATLTRVDVLEQQLSDTGHDEKLLQAELADRDEKIGQLQSQIARESSVLEEVKNTQASLERSLEDASGEKQQLAQQRVQAEQELSISQTSLEKMQSDLDVTRRERDQLALRTGGLEAQNTGLSAQLKETQATVNTQTQLLGEDRDIRDLMGARDLYIAEVYDVARDGVMQKPYGRIFYTKGKSLVFYAYDLDQQPEAKTARTFQAWGENGSDAQRATSLGILFEDSAAKKRWVLKFDDSRALAQINAVFVTVEPSGGSEKPSGKPLLFASLRIEPNHP